jgi:hypothetical protein
VAYVALVDQRLHPLKVGRSWPDRPDLLCGEGGQLRRSCRPRFDDKNRSGSWRSDMNSPTLKCR